MDNLEKKFREVARKSVDCKYSDIDAIMNFHKGVEKPETLKAQLGALWNHALSIGKELGTYEGYSMAKNGEPLGQVDHVN